MAIRNCPNSNCPLWAPVCKPVWDFYEADQCEILFIAEAPGGDEEIIGRPLVGSAGRIFFQALKHAELTTLRDRDTSYIYSGGLNLSPKPNVGLANVVHCRPKGNRAPTTKEMLACSDYLSDTIASCNNLKVIVTLGDTPLAHLLHEQHITKRRGMPAMFLDKICLPTIHPAACMPHRSPELFDLLVRDFIKAAKYLVEGWTPPEITVYDIDESAVQVLIATGFAFDIETTDLSFSHGSIIGIAFSNDPNIAYHAWRDNPHQWELARQLLESGAYKIAQGNSFDVPFLNAKG